MAALRSNFARLGYGGASGIPHCNLSAATDTGLITVKLKCIGGNWSVRNSYAFVVDVM
jgi:hypothetical protein